MRMRGGNWGTIVEVSNDKGPYKLLRVESEGHQFNAIVLEPSGVQVSPMKDGQVFVLPFNADMGQAVALVMPPPAKRTDQQKEGEATFTNHKQGQYIRMDDDGNIHITAKDGANVYINGTKIVTNGDTYVGGEDGALPASRQGTTTSDGASDIGNFATKVFLK